MINRSQRKTLAQALFLQKLFIFMQVGAFLSTWMNGRSIWFRVVESVLIYSVCFVAALIINKKILSPMSYFFGVLIIWMIFFICCGIVTYLGISFYHHLGN